MSGVDGVEKRVGRRRALLSPLRQAIPAGAAPFIWDVNRLGWPALHGIDLDRLALQSPVLQERRRGSIRRLVRSTLDGRFFTSPGTRQLRPPAACQALRPPMGVKERARQLGRTSFSLAACGQRSTTHIGALHHREGVFPLPASTTRSVAGIDDEIERTPLNDRSIATNHSADSPASPLRE
jgi:hypothetical protein